MFLHWFPWQFLVKRAARRFGTIDPIDVLARLRAFSEPSEVQEPFELLRAGIIFHARGLVNTKAIQHNLDWVWPFWVERQFNPADPSFIPRGFSFTHINLTHRNWTAVGLPHLPLYPIVDPRGLLTPLLDGWSVDCWIIGERQNLVPSRLPEVEQRYDFRDGLAVITACGNDGMRLVSEVRMVMDGPTPTLALSIRADSAAAAELAVALRPYNPEGVQFIERLALDRHRVRLLINDETELLFSDPVERLLLSTYRQGDVFTRLTEAEEGREISCAAGMTTGAALYRLEAGVTRELTITVPLDREQVKLSASEHHHPRNPESWENALSGAARLRIPDERMSALYESAVRTLVLLSAHEVFPGPYTYRRFWFRDACLMLHALLNLGLSERCRRAMDHFPLRQRRNGYFHSQAGEWDSNGQVLWLYERYRLLTGLGVGGGWLPAIRKGAKWIIRKRVADRRDPLVDGLLPAGFSAEHFGPNDTYYWDDFWAVAGLRGAASLLAASGDDAKETDRLRHEADGFLNAIMASIARIETTKRQGAIPASPHRRLDAGAIGSLVVDYPLMLTKPGDPAVMATLSFLVENCFQEGGFFQDIIHSGINAYLTLAVAQTMLRAGDPRFRALIDAVAMLATPTGQWPEAIHPRTKGGCMGDGQHGWAAAEWVMMMRNLFVREEGETLIIGSGVYGEWLQGPESIAFGPTPTPWGAIEVTLERVGEKLLVSWHADWRSRAPEIVIKVAGFRPHQLASAPERQQSILLSPS